MWSYKKQSNGLAKMISPDINFVKNLSWGTRGRKNLEPNIPNTMRIAHCYKANDMKSKGWEWKWNGEREEKVIKNKPLHTAIAISPSLPHAHTNAHSQMTRVKVWIEVRRTMCTHTHTRLFDSTATDESDGCNVKPMDMDDG